MKVLVSTPDYFPKLGGLSTFCENIEHSLRRLDIEYELFVWNKVNQINEKKEKEFDKVLNIHFGHSYWNQVSPDKCINFIHGSEVTFTSENLIKKLYKSIFRRRIINYFDQSFKNVFISEFTLKMLIQKGLRTKLNRDLVFHNCINTDRSEETLVDSDDEEIRLICIARDVPHKRIDDAYKLAKNIGIMFDKRVSFFVTSNRFKSAKNLNVKNITGVSSTQRDELFKASHFNILLSRDESKRGYYEGFGLTPLEAGLFGTPSLVRNEAGLSENIHVGVNGYFIKEDLLPPNQLFTDYYKLRSRTYEHTLRSHTHLLYDKILEQLIKA